jgi:hypothetical protein
MSLAAGPSLDLFQRGVLGKPPCRVNNEFIVAAKSDVEKILDRGCEADVQQTFHADFLPLAA